MLVFPVLMGRFKCQPLLDHVAILACMHPNRDSAFNPAFGGKFRRAEPAALNASCCAHLCAQAIPRLSSLGRRILTLFSAAVGLFRTRLGLADRRAGPLFFTLLDRP